MHLMNYRELIDALAYLKENRKLASEADALVSPFVETLCSLQLRFDSNSRTFANPYDASFDGGQTVEGEIIGENLEFSLLLPPNESDWTESLQKGDEFEVKAKFLGFDGLYQRGIFGYQGKIEEEEKEEAKFDELGGEADELVVDEDRMEDDGEPIEELEESMVAWSEDHSMEERETPSSEKHEALEEELSEAIDGPEEEIREDHTHETNLDTKDGIQELEQEASTDKLFPSEPQIEVVDEVSDDLEKQNSGSKPEANDQSNPTVKQQDPVVDHSRDEKELSADEIGRIVDRAKTWGVSGISKKEQVIYRREISRRKRNRTELLRILDKEFNRGIQSLTEEERLVFDQEQARRKKNKDKKKKKPEMPKKVLLFFTIVCLFLSVISLGNESASLFFFFCFLIVYLIHPWVSFWMEEDPCADLFKNRLFREPKFRRGAGLFLLSLCLFSPAPVLGCGLFFVSLFLMYGTKTFKEMQKGFPDEGRRK